MICLKVYQFNATFCYADFTQIFFEWSFTICQPNQANLSKQRFRMIKSQCFEYQRNQWLVFSQLAHVSINEIPVDLIKRWTILVFLWLNNIPMKIAKTIIFELRCLWSNAPIPTKKFKVKLVPKSSIYNKAKMILIFYSTFVFHRNTNFIIIWLVSYNQT